MFSLKRIYEKQLENVAKKPRPDQEDELGGELDKIETGEVNSLQNLLQNAYNQAKSIGDEKLLQQLANVITYYTRNHVLAKDEVMEESKRLQELAGIKEQRSKKLFGFTPEGEKLKLELDNKMEENPDYDYWDDMNDDERLIADLGMYEEGAYIDPDASKYTMSSWIKAMKKGGDDPNFMDNIKKGIQNNWFQLNQVK